MLHSLGLLTRTMTFSAVAALSLGVGTSADAQDKAPLPDYVIEAFGTPPPVPDGPLSPELREALQTAFAQTMQQRRWGHDQTEALQVVVASEDPRAAWLISDLLRFTVGRDLTTRLSEAASALLGKPLGPQNAWGEVTDHLMAWDIPAPPEYLDIKREIYIAIVPQWERIFVEGDVDWRFVSWGGVPIDDRPHHLTNEPCNCIPAADNPAVQSAEEATWLDDDDIVYGIEINGETRAYPRQIMEVREMVNDTLGGRDLGIPYCTLCGAAQAYFTDDLPDGVERPILRTSGLLSRSNKVMFDLNTYSVFDTFLGKALTGPLAEAGVHLKQASVVTSDWGAWKAAHPDTTVLVEALALGRKPDFRNTRDANGPIFPIGDVDPRLPVQEDIIGVVTEAGTPLAFQRSAAYVALTNGDAVRVGDVELVLDAGGIRAVDSAGEKLGSHEAFWFAWSQFHPDTVLWPES